MKRSAAQLAVDLKIWILSRFEATTTLERQAGRREVRQREGGEVIVRGCIVCRSAQMSCTERLPLRPFADAPFPAHHPVIMPIGAVSRWWFGRQSDVCKYQRQTQPRRCQTCSSSARTSCSGSRLCESWSVESRSGSGFDDLLYLWWADGGAGVRSRSEGADRL